MRRSRTPARRAGLIMLCLAAASCAAEPEPPVKAPVAIPASFSQSGDRTMPAEWWRELDDPVLDALIAQALSGSLTLREVWDRLAAAEAEAAKEGAALSPTVDLGADSSGSAMPSGQSPSFSLNLIAEYEIDLWGRLRSARDAAELDVRATVEELMAAAITLTSQVALTWYQLVEQYGQIDLLESQLDTNEKVLELITLRFRRGQAGAIDVLQQRQLAESNRGDIATARARVAVLSHELAILLGEPPNEPDFERVATLADLPPLPKTGLPSTLVQRRPDVRQAFYDILAADRRVASAVADQYPRLSLMANVGMTSDSLRSLLDNWMATLAANLLAPLIDGGARAAEVDRTRAVLSENVHNYGDVILNAFLEVEDALAQESEQHLFIASLDKQLKLSEQVIDRARDSYFSGAVDYLRVLDALLTSQGLQRTRLTAQRELIDFRIQLYRALAGGWAMKQPILAGLEEAAE